MFCYIWEFLVAPAQEAAFEAAYGAEGPWVRLFERDPEHIGTELYRDAANPRRFVTIDRWTSRAAYLSFRERVGAEHDAIDVACERCTESERHLGDFELSS